MVKTQSAISAMYLRKSNSYTENTVYPGLREIDIKRGMLKKAKDLIRSIRSNHPWLKLNKEEFFRAAGLIRYDSTIGKSGYTLAALMLFGTDEAISSYLPYYKIEAIVRKQDLMRYDDRLTVTCNLIDGYELLNGFIEKHLPDKFYLDGKTRLSLRDKIFREVIANMLIHREYMNPIPTTLVIYKDKLVTNNANKPFAYEKIASQFCSYPKNPHIATMFAQMGFAEYLGTGIRKISDLCEIYSGLRPNFVDNDIFIAEIPLTDHVPEGEKSGGLNGGLSGGLKIELNETQQKVFLEITKRPGVMIKELSGRLQMPIDTLDKVVSSLRKKELIERRGSKKTGGYWVKKEPTSTNW